MKLNSKAFLLLALLSLCALQLTVGKHNTRKWREPELSPEEEEEEWEAAEEDERRRQEEWEEEHHTQRRRRHDEPEEGGGGGRRKPIKAEDFFLMGEPKRVMGSEAGEMRVVRSFGYGRYSAGATERPLHVGFITMEPRSMFVPQYLDSTLVLFIQRGEAKIGLIYKDALVERRLRTGDIYRVPAGSAFYIVNTAEGQRLHAVCSIDPSQSIGFGAFQSFFISGGSNPTSVLSGFSPETLSTALNVSIGELKDVMSSQEAGPFVYTDSHVPTMKTNPFANFESMKKEEKLRKLKSVIPVVDHDDEDDEDDEDEDKQGWSFSKIFNGIFRKDSDRKRKKKGDRKGDEDVGSGPDPFNVYEADPSFKNNYGSSLAVDKHVYKPLKKSHLSVYYVNLTAGTMLAPHINPVATEYGIVLRGSGTIQIVYPNGTTALNAKIREGSVFRVPRYFPFCQVASRSGPLEFFGFTTSAKRNHPQFLVGATSVIKTMWGQEFAAAFGVTEERLREIFDSQREAIALPSPGASPGSAEDVAEEEKAAERVPEGVKVLAREMIMG